MFITKYWYLCTYTDRYRCQYALIFHLLFYNSIGEWEGLSCWMERVMAQKDLLQGWERSKDEILLLKNSILEGQKVGFNSYICIPPYICILNWQLIYAYIHIDLFIAPYVSCLLFCFFLGGGISFSIAPWCLSHWPLLNTYHLNPFPLKPYVFHFLTSYLLIISLTTIT